MFLVVKLKSLLRKPYGRHHDLVTEYMCHKWPQICSVFRNHYLMPSSFMINYRICNKSSRTGAISRAGTAYPSRAHEFTSFFGGIRVARSLVFCVVVCRLLFVISSFGHYIIALSVLLFTTSELVSSIFSCTNVDATLDNL